MKSQSQTVLHTHKRRPEAMKPGSMEGKPVLAQQYGGRHVGGWVSRLPEPWIPYVQLMRLSPPAALALIYFPHLFGSLLAAIIKNSPPGHIVRTSTILLTWSLFFSNAAHAWNDLVDAPFDAAVARTRQRPIPRGAISPRAAFIFASSQILIGIGVLHFGLAGTEGQGTMRYILPNLFATLYYPYAKRHTDFAQLVLGLCLAWGVFVGSAAMGHEPFAIRSYLALPLSQNKVSPSIHISAPVFCLMLGCVIWSTIYDTIYAHQDLADDRRLGLRSMAVLLGERGTKPVLSFLLCVMVLLLWTCGYYLGFMPTWPFMLIAPSGSVVSLGAMIANVKLQDSRSCWWWFRYGFWAAGCSMAGGLLAEYTVRRFWSY